MAEHLGEGIEALYSFFDIDREQAETPIAAAQPDDQYIDSALISFAQASNPDLPPQRNHKSAMVAARHVLMQTEAKEFKLGNLWLLLTDYKRLLLKGDVLQAWREEQATGKSHLKTRFLHVTMETLRLSDLPELLLDYRHLVESSSHSHLHH